MNKRFSSPQIVANFIQNLCYIALLVFVIIAAINKLGVDTTSFAVVVGAAGLAIGFALQGSLVAAWRSL
jgi:small conductance mechanosensitive channel